LDQLGQSSATGETPTEMARLRGMAARDRRGLQVDQLEEAVAHSFASKERRHRRVVRQRLAGSRPMERPEGVPAVRAAGEVRDGRLADGSGRARTSVVAGEGKNVCDGVAVNHVFTGETLWEFG